MCGGGGGGEGRGGAKGAHASPLAHETLKFKAFPLALGWSP